VQQQEGGLDILLSNLDRLDEKIDEERQGVYNMMGILENVSEVMPEIGVMAMKNDVWRKWVLRRYTPARLCSTTLDCVLCVCRWSCVCCVCVVGRVVCVVCVWCVCCG
jgi:hypothetical protein